ncbi:glycosyltransferase family 2 protein [Cytophagaceae bacterium ABcell3]|nr:glycosyltransferase family 2 protein [Cytophagaceae bacterium ABcell3]
MNLDIVLPCYNPIDSWVETIISSYQTLCKRLPDTNINIYLVNDGSGKKIKDSDIEYLNANIKSFHYISYYFNRGKGYALRKGVKKTKSEIVIFTDVDFPYEEDSLLKVYNVLVHKEADICLGIRDESYYEKVPPERVKLSKFLRYITRKLLSIPVNDTQCGLKGFNQRGKDIFLKTSIKRYLFDIEFIFLAARTQGIIFKPIEVKLKPGIVFSKINFKLLFKEILNFIFIFIRFRLIKSK